MSSPSWDEFSKNPYFIHKKSLVKTCCFFKWWTFRAQGPQPYETRISIISSGSGCSGWGGSGGATWCHVSARVGSWGWSSHLYGGILVYNALTVELMNIPTTQNQSKF